MENKNNDSNDIFEDLLKETPISSLRFEEREFGSFNPDAAVKMASDHKPPKKKFGKRAHRGQSGSFPTQGQPVSLGTESQMPAQPAKKEPKEQQATPEPRTQALVHEEEMIKTSDTAEFEIDDKLFDYPASAKQTLRKDAMKSAVEDLLDNTAAMNLFAALDQSPAALDAATDTAADTKEESKENFEDVLNEELSDASFDRNLPEDEDDEESDDEEYEDEDELIDPDASLVDDYDYDLYEDKKRFLLSDYKRIEDYLARQSRQGYQYLRHEGKRYYFHKEEPHNYYYQILYFTTEPVESQWKIWKDAGWKLISRVPAKNKKEAGWFILRNEEVPGKFKETIDNEEEKYRFFRKYANSCRSTMFLLFICMAICAVMGSLQYYFKGYLAGILFCVVLFVISLWVFLVYGRMLRKAKKQARLLKARLRLAKSRHNVMDEVENEEDLDQDWQRLEEESEYE